MLYTPKIMNGKPNLPNEIFWGKDYSLRMDGKVNGWLTLATLISACADVLFRHTVQGWPVEARVGIVIAEFVCLALWARAMTQWIRGMDEMHRQITTSVVLFAVSATFFVMLLWHCLEKAGLFDVIFPKPKDGSGWDICHVGHGFLLLVLFYGIAQSTLNRRYR